MNNKDFKHILYLPAWYPHPKDSMFGLFVKNHALACSKFCNVSVLYVVFYDDLDETFKVQIKTDSNFTELIIFVKKPSKKLLIAGRVIQFIRYFSAYKAGYKIIHDAVGKPDLNHVHILTRAGVIALYYKIKFKIPYLISEHWSRYLPEHKSFTGFFRIWITKKVVAKAEAVVTVSEYLQKSMKSFDLIAKRWEIIPNTVDDKRFRPDISFSNSSINRFFHISCFEDKSKNISGILQAIALVSEKRTDFEFVLIGDGEDLLRLKDLSQSLNIEKLVQFVGVLEGEKLIETINSCNFMVMFSNYETFGTVVLESFACGKPVIVSNGGALPEIAPEKFAKIVEVKNVQNLSKAILEMMDTHMLYNKDEMVEYVSENYSVDSVGFALSKLYNTILSL